MRCPCAWTRRRRNLIVTSLAGLGALSVLLPRNPKPVQLNKDWLEIDAEPDQVFEALTALDEGPTIVARSVNQIIAEFPIRTGWYTVTTLERVTLDPNRRQVKFEQLRSPFFSLQTATEVFDLSRKPGGGTTIILNGALSPRLGLFGWLITQRIVRPRWNAIDANFLARVRERAESMNS